MCISVIRKNYSCFKLLNAGVCFMLALYQSHTYVPTHLYTCMTEGVCKILPDAQHMTQHCNLLQFSLPAKNSYIILSKILNGYWISFFCNKLNSNVMNGKFIVLISLILNIPVSIYSSLICFRYGMCGYTKLARIPGKGKNVFSLYFPF